MPTVITEIDTLLTAANQAAAVTALTGILEGAAPVAGKIGEEYLPEVLSPDWITLPSQTGVIPANSLGQKAGILHYGETPILPVRQALGPLHTSGYDFERLATFPLAASEMVDAKEFYLEIDLQYKISGTPGDDDYHLLKLDFESGADHSNGTGSYIILPGAINDLTFKGIIRIEEATGFMTPVWLDVNLSFFRLFTLASNAATDTPAAVSAVFHPTTGLIDSAVAGTQPAATAGNLILEISTVQFGSLGTPGGTANCIAKLERA